MSDVAYVYAKEKKMIGVDGIIHIVNMNKYLRDDTTFVVLLTLLRLTRLSKI